MTDKLSFENALPHYISLQEATDQTGLSYYYLRQLVIDGKVPFIKSGVKYLINSKGLSDYLLKLQEGEK